MSETLQNDNAARSPTGEILDVSQAKSDTQQTKSTDQTKSESTTTTSNTQQTEGKSVLTGAETKTESEGKSVLTGDGKQEGKTTPQGAPETYADFKVPDGYTLDPEVSKEAGAIFKGLNLSQDQAQQLVDFYINKTNESFQAPFKAWQTMQETWQNEIKNHPYLGPRIDQIAPTVSRALDALNNPVLKAKFQEAAILTGAGNNPAIAEVVFRLAEMLTEGGYVRGSGPSKFGQQSPGSKPESAAKAMYPNLP